MTDWQQLPPGAALRRKIAQSAGWHMRKIPVSSGGVAYDFFIYDNDDRLAFHREITPDDLNHEQQAVDQTWLAAMEDEDTPRWDEDLQDALWLIDKKPCEARLENGIYHAWVGSQDYQASAETEPLALMRAWLSWAQVHLHYD